MQSPSPSNPSNTNASESPKHFYQHSWVRFASLFMIVLILVGFWLYSETLIASIESLRAELNQTRLALARQQEIVNVLSSPELSIQRLGGAYPQHSGVLFLDRSTGAAALETSNLPATDDRTAYHLWVSMPKGFLPASSFEKDSIAPHPFWITLTLDSSLRHSDEFIVTLESDPRPEHPSSLVVLSTRPAK